MSQMPSLLLVIVSYLAILFWIARIGDKHHADRGSWTRSPAVYAFALGVYCTSWTFFGLVGTAAESGWLFMPILLGPILLFVFARGLCLRVARLCQQENTRSIADFLSARYGKRRGIASSVTLIVLLSTVPYIALQLKAVTDSLMLISPQAQSLGDEMGFLIACAMVGFSLVFGVRRLEMAGYHGGLMSAIAFESVVKLVAIVAAALFAFTYILSDPANIEAANIAVDEFFWPSLDYRFVLQTIVSALAILCLPRMFHVVFVEQLSESHFRFGSRVFAFYLLIFILCIIVITIAGRVILQGQNISGDSYVLLIPINERQHWLTLLTFIGGFSASTAMTIVATVTLSYMLSNDVILPMLLRRRKEYSPAPDFSTALINARRITVLLVVGLAYLYQLAFAGNAALTDIGLIAFALAVQLAPAMLFGIYSQKGNATGTYCALAAGCLLWFFTLFFPLMARSGAISGGILESGLFGLQWLRPEHLFNFEFVDAYSHGVTISLLANIFAYWLGSFFSDAKLADKIQAKAFFSLSRAKSSEKNTSYQIADLYALTVKFLGENATQQLIRRHSEQGETVASAGLLDAIEHALSGIVGVPSAIAMISMLEDEKKYLGVEDVVNIFEETTKALRFNQDMIYASFESIESGISVVNEELHVVSWNRRYEEMFNYPANELTVGRPVEELVRYNAQRGMLGPGSINELVSRRLSHLKTGKPYRVVRNHGECVIEIKGSPLPNGGYVTTYTDISEFIDAQERLEKTKLYLEERVRQRTNELLKAEQTAVEANIIKSKFIAQASHDILQPLNAARLYSSLLLEQAKKTGGDNVPTIEHLNEAIESSESIIATFLEISKLDTGAIQTTLSTVPIRAILDPLINEFNVSVKESLSLEYIPSTAYVHTDPRYLRRIVQNFISNALKYTEKGRIALGCRRHSDSLEVCVFDTGPGINESDLGRIFDDFYRVSLDSDIPGAGLGLAVVKRFSDLLNHPIECTSVKGKGSCFSVLVPYGLKAESTAATAAIPLNEMPHESLLLGKSLLYVDDDEQNVRAMQALLSEWGAQPITAIKAEDAQAFVDDSGVPVPDVIIVDWDLNDDNDGIMLTNFLRKGWGKNIPACLVSAAPDANLGALAASHQMEFLKKPIKPGRLRATLEQLLKRQEIKKQPKP